MSNRFSFSSDTYKGKGRKKDNGSQMLFFSFRAFQFEPARLLFLDVDLFPLQFFVFYYQNRRRR